MTARRLGAALARALPLGCVHGDGEARERYRAISGSPTCSLLLRETFPTTEESHPDPNTDCCKRE